MSDEEDMKEDLLPEVELDMEDTSEQEPEGAPEQENDEVVERAKKYGHLSKEEWEAQGRDPAQWKSPEEFDKTGKVIEQLYTLKKKVDQRDREIQALVDYQKRTAQREYEKAKQELEARLSASKDDMDVDNVVRYTKELTKLEEMENTSQVQQRNRAQESAKQEFIERNQHWFNDRNPDLIQKAIEIDAEVKMLYPNDSFEELGRKIEARMRYEHPERVSGQRSSGRPSLGQSSVNKTAVVKKDSFKNLSQEHRDTFNVYKRINPKITEAEFVQRLKADGEI